MDCRTSPFTCAEAALELQKLARLDRRQLRATLTPLFLIGWKALLFLFPDLHPDNALDHGQDTEMVGGALCPRLAGTLAPPFSIRVCRLMNGASRAGAVGESGIEAAEKVLRERLKVKG